MKEMKDTTTVIRIKSKDYDFIKKVERKLSYELNRDVKIHEIITALIHINEEKLINSVSELLRNE